MLTLDQVRLLENRVEKAVGKITSLTEENNRLRSQLSTLQSRTTELEGFVTSFKDDQGKIEAGILNALEQLSVFEDSLTEEESLEPEQITPPVDTEQETSNPIVTDSISEEEIDTESPTSTETEDNGQIDIF
ncbi:MAG TPA: cell division protein ZapB [Treponema sp.]|nr:cell division protein ZapB [Treponema sp.]